MHKSHRSSQILHSGPLIVFCRCPLSCLIDTSSPFFSVTSSLFLFFSTSSFFSSLSSAVSITPFPVGPVSVHLSSPLSLEEIRRRNPLVSPGGHYQPPDCRPQHHTAIVVPYRNRQNHLRALLYHLHPFLQRQQIHYSIYIVQQVMPQSFFVFFCFDAFPSNPGIQQSRFSLIVIMKEPPASLCSQPPGGSEHFGLAVSFCLFWDDIKAKQL